MKKALKILAVLIVVGIIVLQFFGIDKTNPPIVPSETLEATVAVPPDVSQIIVRSCNDCHTNSTIYPWYSNVQPIGWFLKNHIDDGKRDLNFSIFNTYTAKKKAKRLEDICELVQSKEMPLPSYLWIHRESVLSDSDIKTLCDWSKQEESKIAVE
ncbi:MAG: heme-binding domain-containing protein [Acidobacteriota bacterium]